MGDAEGTTTQESARTAGEIARDVRLGMRARRMLDPRLKPGRYLAALIERGLHADAVRFMAHALINREAVWWACLCARWAADGGGAAAGPASLRALEAATRWVLGPSTDRRQLAGRAADAAGIKLAAGAAARAASYASGGPVDPVGPAVEPILAARLASAAALSAVAADPAGGSSARFRQALAIGLDVAYGSNRWER